MLGDKKTPISTVVGERKQQLQMVGGYDNIRERVHTMDIWSVMEDFSRIPPT
jgi:hypothetical protein